MSLTRIRTNTRALRSYSQLQQTYRELALRRRHLATGRRINSAEDDSAGYFVAQRLESRVRGQAQALANVGDAKAMLGVAEGGLESQREILQDLKGKITKAASGTMGQRERVAIHRSVQKGLTELEEIAGETSFNGRKLLDGSAGKQAFQVGSGAGETFGVSLGGTTLGDLDVEKSFDPGTTNLPEGFIPEIDLSAYTGPEDLVRDMKITQVKLDKNYSGYVLDWRVDVEVYNAEGTKVAEGTIGSRETEVENILYGDDSNGNGSPAEDEFNGAVADFSDLDWRDFVHDPESPDAVEGPDSLYYNEGTFRVRLGGPLNVSTAEWAGVALTRVEDALETVSKRLSHLGTAQKRLSFKEENLSTARTNYASARSRIIDADFAREQLAIVKQQILQQAGQASLTQANRAPQSVLSLLGGGAGQGGLLNVVG